MNNLSVAEVDHISQSVLIQETNLNVVEGDHINQHLTLVKNLNVVEEGHPSIEILPAVVMHLNQRSPKCITHIVLHSHR